MGRALDPAKEVLVVVSGDVVGERVAAAVTEAGFYPIRTTDPIAARTLLASGSVNPCVILVLLAGDARSNDVSALLSHFDGRPRIPLVMFSTGDDASIAEPNPTLVRTLVKMVEHQCER